MRLSLFVLRLLQRHAARVRASRPYDFAVGEDDPGGVYLRRWWDIPRNAAFNIYIHEFLRSDDDRALHDHMYINLSILLEGEYTEHTISAGGVRKATVRKAGDMKFRLPWSAHRIAVEKPCCTLFITGPRIRNWGFHCPQGWRRWEDYTAPGRPGNRGRGCD